MSEFRRKRKVWHGAISIGYALLLTGCYVGKPLCPAYVDSNYIEYGEYEWNAPLECSTWYEDPYGYMWVTTSKADALIKWSEITARPMEFEIQGEFRYSVTAADGYKYFFWNMYTTPDQCNYYVTVNKSVDEIQRIDL